MAHIARSIEIDDPVGIIYEQWMRFEELAPSVVDGTEAHIRWRAEVLSFEPRGSRTRVTFRVEFDPVRDDAGLRRRVERTLERFKVYVEARLAPAR